VVQVIQSLLGWWRHPWCALVRRTTGLCEFGTDISVENGLIANNRLILLDPPLLFFTSATLLVWVNFFKQQQRLEDAWID
jgi:dolichyl-phosphate-mannose--protein O-mannosyl transferase